MTDDPFDLQRFVDAQEGIFNAALSELRAGEKRSHWMWFIFPQLGALGRSLTATFYGIRSLDEARAYLAHPLLDQRYHQVVEAMMAWAGKRDAVAILGSIDAMKLRSSLTLFQQTSGEASFAQALAAFFDGPDAQTLELLRG
ncbi:DUF1810 domain-containing protein [Sphingomonas sp. SM33]|uniref:DUF1810 domain-containing protein n=1 Tax=Sphingomonas telluris TaxID=2907998 RepID=A0ABS9VPK2_9SPHN|nr:DUF1810 domain-containing protein [Sphingomonas telluris]MCH8616887.1 DUF1810 domain-containing protein [Sphingomonas telluris]